MRATVFTLSIINMYSIEITFWFNLSLWLQYSFQYGSWQIWQLRDRVSTAGFCIGSDILAPHYSELSLQRTYHLYSWFKTNKCNCFHFPQISHRQNSPRQNSILEGQIFHTLIFYFRPLNWHIYAVRTDYKQSSERGLRLDSVWLDW